MTVKLLSFNREKITQLSMQGLYHGFILLTARDFLCVHEIRKARLSRLLAVDYLSHHAKPI